MIFISLAVGGACVLDVEKRQDERGFFARVWCQEELAAYGLPATLAQASVAFTRCQGTLRGMHYQAAPHEEDKLVRCTRGAAHVVVLDLRPQSASYLRWVGVDLSGDNHRTVFVPKGCAQGYQTLADDTEMFYQMTVPYAPAAACGVRYNDPAFGIAWPLKATMISERDRNWPDYEPAR
jgi:dTDP-4-dehydrorhamnose 3,5-epimerase